MRPLKICYERYLSLLETKLDLNVKRMEATAELSDLNNTLRVRKNRKNYMGIPFSKEEEMEIRTVLEWLKEEVRYLDLRLASINKLIQQLDVISYGVVFLAIAQETLDEAIFDHISEKAGEEYEKWVFAQAYLKFRPEREEFVGFEPKLSLRDSVDERSAGTQTKYETGRTARPGSLRKEPSQSRQAEPVDPTAGGESVRVVS